MHPVLANFVEENEYDDLAVEILSEIEKHDGQGKDVEREYLLNLYYIHIYFLSRAVFIEHLYDHDPEAEATISLDEFIEAMESKVKKCPV